MGNRDGVTVTYGLNGQTAPNTGARVDTMNNGQNAGEKQAKRGAGNGGNVPPPVRRWKPGQSGNPRGKPKGTRNVSTIMREMLAQRASALRMGKGLPPEATVADALVVAAVKQALDGSHAHLQTLLDRTEGKVADKHEVGGSQGQPIQIVNFAGAPIPPVVPESEDQTTRR